MEPAAAALIALLSTADTGVPACNYDTLSVSGWETSALENTSASTMVTIRYVSAGEEPIDMVEGKVTFHDPLGREVMWLPIGSPDMTVQPGAEYEDTIAWPSYEIDRLTAIGQDRVTTEVCVKSVLYTDGTVVRFSGGK